MSSTIQVRVDDELKQNQTVCLKILERTQQRQFAFFSRRQ